MPDIATQIDVTADPAAVYRALITSDGVAGWWTTRNQTHGTVGQVDQMWFPDAPMAWELRVDEAVPGKLLARHCVGGPPGWVGTDVRFTLEPTPDGGTLVVFDHTGFAEVDEMFRRVTMGWSQMLLQLKQYTESGEPAPFFDF
jgi:uncharacterized protein YndB with AHSA1/START domain